MRCRLTSGFIHSLALLGAGILVKQDSAELNVNDVRFVELEREIF